MDWCDLNTVCFGHLASAGSWHLILLVKQVDPGYPTDNVLVNGGTLLGIEWNRATRQLRTNTTDLYPTGPATENPDSSYSITMGYPQPNVVVGDIITVRKPCGNVCFLVFTRQLSVTVQGFPGNQLPSLLGPLQPNHGLRREGMSCDAYPGASSELKLVEDAAHKIAGLLYVWVSKCMWVQVRCGAFGNHMWVSYDCTNMTFSSLTAWNPTAFHIYEQVTSSIPQGPCKVPQATQRLWHPFKKEEQVAIKTRSMKQHQ